MAVIPGVPGLSVTIVVDGQNLREYEDESDQPMTGIPEVVKFVESTSGSTFSVLVKTTPDFDLAPEESLNPQVYIDGNFTRGKLLGPESLSRGYRFEGPIYKEGAHWMLSKYTFADIVTSEESVATLNPDAVKYLGTIIVAFRTVIRIGSVLPMAPCSAPAALVGALPETKLKGLEPGQQVSYTEANVTGALMTRDLIYPNGPQDSARVIFKYRSRASLQCKLLIPRTPSPPPVENSASPPVDDELGQMGHDELLDYVRRSKKEGFKHGGNTSIKRERSTTFSGSVINDGDDDDDCIMLPPKKKVKEVIDLSD